MDASLADDGEDTPHISIATGIIVALSASWLSSLGLTIQRKSHLQNERQPLSSRRVDHRRPLWLLGFIIFITSNVLGSVFQIGALSITLLAPLGAVSLLWNAFFARILLGDVFSRYLILGTILIAGGAVLIAIFGVVPEKTHSLEELIQLYTRPSFIVWMALQFALLIAVLAYAHWSESHLERNLQDVYISIPTSPDATDDEALEDDEENDFSRPLLEAVSSHVPFRARRRGVPTSAIKKARKIRRWSTPPSYLAMNGASELDGHPADTASGVSAIPQPPETPASAASFLSTAPSTPQTTKSTFPTSGAARSDIIGAVAPGSRNSRHVSFGQTAYRTFGNSVASSPVSSTATGIEPKPYRKPGFKPTLGVDTGRRLNGSGGNSSIQPRFSHDRAEQRRMWLGIAYGSASGTMSGLCLLFAKTGVELLILTVVGQNQFKRWESWMIVLALLICALLQLYYLNKSLRLVGPTLICPLAFCLYNISSIFNGLMYYNQWARLTALQDGLMSLGIAILLGGVWIVSIKSPGGDVTEELGMAECSSDEEAGLLSPSAMSEDVEFDVNEQSHRESEDEQNDQRDDAEGDEHEETFADLKRRISSLYQAFLLDQAGPPRGFSVGISASSPGFAIRPQYHHTRRNTTASSSSLLRSSTTSSASDATFRPAVRHSHTRSDDLVISPAASMHNLGESPRPSGLMNRTTSEPGPGAELQPAASSSSTRDRDAALHLSHRHRRKRSLAGDYYVGSSNPFAEEPVFHQSEQHASITSPTSPGRGRSRAGSAASAGHRSMRESLPSPRLED